MTVFSFPFAISDACLTAITRLLTDSSTNTPTLAPRSPHAQVRAVNGLIELARRVARRFRDPDNYRLRMLLIGGGLRL